MNIKDFKSGWDFSKDIITGNLGSEIGNDYIEKVSESIQELEKNINTHDYKNSKNFQGYVQEEWLYISQ